MYSVCFRITSTRSSSLPSIELPNIAAAVAGPFTSLKRVARYFSPCGCGGNRRRAGRGRHSSAFSTFTERAPKLHFGKPGRYGLHVLANLGGAGRVWRGRQSGTGSIWCMRGGGGHPCLAKLGGTGRFGRGLEGRFWRPNWSTFWQTRAVRA